MNVNTVVLELTQRCNLTCKYCSAYKQEHRQRPDMPAERWMEIIDKLAVLCPNKTILSGGEPFLYPDFSKVYNYCLEKLPYIGITTNSVSIKPVQYQLLKEKPPASIQISIDGPKAYQDKMRGSGTYDICIRAIKTLIEHKIQVYTMTVVTKENLALLPEFVCMLKDLGVSRVGFERLSPIGRGRELGELLLNEDDLRKLASILQTFQDTALGCSCNDPVINALKYQKRMIPKTYLPLDGCMAGIQNYAIDFEGYLKPCTRLPIRLGMFVDMDFSDMHSANPLLKNLVLRNFLGKCETCDKLMVCGGCRAEAFGLTGNVCGEDSACFIS